MSAEREGREGGGARDDTYSREQSRIADFSFGRETAAVFDDMLERSVPFYGEIQRMLAELTADFAVDGSRIYDLGCSTCNTFVAIDRRLPADRDVEYVGIDSSPEMLEQAKRKLVESNVRRSCEFRRADLDHGVELENASVALLVLTLQFVRPLNRERLVASIHRGLRENGCLLLVEKVMGESSTINRLFIDHYYQMKRRHGYSELQIAQKREALENVLIPYRLEENKALLREVGFTQIDVFFKWYNFCGIVAVQ